MKTKSILKRICPVLAFAVASFFRPDTALAVDIHVTVNAKTPSVDTGVMVAAGQSITITATGTIGYGSLGPLVCRSTNIGPNGCSAEIGLHGFASGSLVGHIGSGSPFFVGASSVISAAVSGTGELFLNVNDGPSDYNDNSGSFAATITVGTKVPSGAAISLFCNRSGVNLTTADCSVTVGDTGVSPRTTPTGTVDFVATGGLVPNPASCSLQQTPYSPGVASCSVQFTLPLNFPIGVAFPLDATYEGDSKFSPVSTSHSLIQAGCVGDPGSPCPGAVALTFVDVPAILKKAISTVCDCGDATVASEGLLIPRSHVPLSAACTGTITARSDVLDKLATMSVSEILALSAKISKKDADSDSLLAAIRALAKPENLQKLSDSINNRKRLDDLLMKAVQLRSAHVGGSLDDVAEDQAAYLRKSKLSTVVQFGSAVVNVKNNSRKVIKIKLTKVAAKFAKAFKAAGIGDLDISLTLKGKRSSGPKHPFNTTQKIDVGLK